METKKPKVTHFSTIIVVAIVIAGLLAGGLAGYSIGYSTIYGKMKDLQNQLSTLQSTQTIVCQTNTYILGENISLSELYDQVKDSVVMIRAIIVQYDFFGRPYYTEVQGSGFIYNFTGTIVVVTNYHVVEGTINITATFINGNGYAATLLGSDSYSDLAVLSTSAPQSEYKPLEIVSSSTLEVGDPVIALGNPYGLAGSMTTGIVSALGRTLTEDLTGGYAIADIIQTSTPINPGNSGGPLMNYKGQVVGITTAIVSDSQGLGFAIPSNTILREIESLITKGTYNRHPWLGASGSDMTYETASSMGTDITYGWLITQVNINGPAANAGLKNGDIITGIDGTRIIGIDDLSTYLEEYTSPNQTVNVTIARNNQTMTLPVTLGTRPSATQTI